MFLESEATLAGIFIVFYGDFLNTSFIKIIQNMFRDNENNGMEFSKIRNYSI